MTKVAMGRGLLASLVVGAALMLVPAAASAAIDDVFGGDVSCSVEPDGIRFCGSSSPRSTTKTFDGVPIDVNVAFPPAPASGADGSYPLVMMFHGYGGQKMGLPAMRPWLERGYATFSMTNRGFRESCGSVASRTADPAGCENGYVRLIDSRYEVRDAQLFAGLLADEGVGLIDPQKIASIGGSYGGGMSMSLAALRNRTYVDGRLVPWTSPNGKAMEIAASAPSIPWTDLAYSLAPNGSTLDYVDDAPYTGRPGVSKQSLTSGLYLTGQAAPGFYAPEGTDPAADLTGWRNRLNQGEPYGADVQAILDELTSWHSSYYIDDSVRPAPLLMASGFTDDLFPADETIRFYNRTRGSYPNADMALYYGDFGHPRANNKPDVEEAISQATVAWFDHYVKGEGPEPQQGVTAYTQTCPAGGASGGPFHADNWAKLAKGEIRVQGGEPQTIAPDSNTNGQFNPPFVNACATVNGAAVNGSATYELDPAPEGGYTLMGSVSVIAGFTLPGDTSQVAARLLDVAPDGKSTLVARGLWRPATGGPTRQVFQLFPNGWKFEAGHAPRLELVAFDGTPANTAPFLSSYGRPSNDQQPVTVGNLRLRMPVLEKPGALDGTVGAPASKFLPDGYEPAVDFAELPQRNLKLFTGKRMKVNGRKVALRVKCPPGFAACHDGELKLSARGKYKGKKLSFDVASTGVKVLAGGESATVRAKLSKRAQRFLKRKRNQLKVHANVTTREVSGKVRVKGIVKAKKIKR